MKLKKKSEIKILQIITLFSIGGATETVVSMAERLIKKGYKVDIATGPHINSEGSMYDTAEEKKLSVITFRNLRREINLLRDIAIIIQLALFIRKGNYDVVHTHSSKAGVVGRIAAFLANTPLILHTVHGLPFHRYQPEIKKKFFIWVEKFSNLFSNKIIAVTDTIIQTMLDEKIGSKDKYYMVRSGFDTSNYQQNGNQRNFLRHRYGINENDIVIGKIARLSELKGHKYLLEAFIPVSHKIPNAKLLIVGNGELEYELKRLVESKKIGDKVIFSGLITPEEIPNVIEVMDILVHTSLLEGLARVLPQAIMMKKPVISFNLDGAHEVIKSGETGYLIQPLNVKDLSEKIIYLCQNPHLICKFGEEGKNFIGDQFSSEVMVDKIEEVYLKNLF
jgi:glycosyltransferase involved in cell wall biosynthesis